MPDNIFNYMVSSQMRVPAQPGEVGFELEVEGSHLPSNIPGEGWSVHRDGSLRGESFEYVFSGPKNRAEVDPLLSVLFDTFGKSRAVLNTSYRTSAHVHLNLSQRSFQDVVNLFCLYTIVEPILMNFCGPQRKGNLFCLRVADAEHITDTIERAIKRCDMSMLFGDNMRYAAINLAALGKYGSIEFRAMRGLIEREACSQWVSILLDLQDKAFAYDIPRRMVEDFSILGPEGFLRSIFTQDNYDLLMQHHNSSSSVHGEDLVPMMFNSLRRIQTIAYEYADEMLEGIEYRKNAPVAKPSKKKSMFDDFVARQGNEYRPMAGLRGFDNAFVPPPPPERYVDAAERARRSTYEAAKLDLETRYANEVSGRIRAILAQEHSTLRIVEGERIARWKRYEDPDYLAHLARLEAEQDIIEEHDDDDFELDHDDDDEDYEPEEEEPDHDDDF